MHRSRVALALLLRLDLGRELARLLLVVVDLRVCLARSAYPPDDPLRAAHHLQPHGRARDAHAVPHERRLARGLSRQLGV